jgi:hypothetical protein
LVRVVDRIERRNAQRKPIGHDERDADLEKVNAWTVHEAPHTSFQIDNATPNVDT